MIGEVTYTMFLRRVLQMKHIHMCGPFKKALMGYGSGLVETSRLWWFSGFSSSPRNSFQRVSFGCVHHWHAHEEYF
jgi:hypothetical protein